MARCIWYISKYLLTPVGSAPGSRGYVIMREIARLGHQAVVITSDSMGMFGAPEADEAYVVEHTDGLILCRIRTLKYAVAKSVARMLSWIDFEFRLLRLPKGLLPRPDAVVVSSLSLLTVLNGLRLRRRYGCRLIFEVRDIWPLTLTEEGGFSPRNPLVVALSIIEKLGYRRADAIVGTMPNLGEHVKKVSGSERPTYCIPMGVDVSTIQSPEVLPAEYVAAHVPDGRFLVAYAGSIGISNALEAFFQCAERMRDDPRIHFVIVGDGDLRAGYVAKYGDLPNVTFAPRVAKELVHDFLSRCDLLYFAVHPSAVWDFGLSLNKLIDYMLAAKPIVASYSGYPSMVNEANCGTFVAAGDVDGLEAEIRRIALLPAEERVAMGTRGRAWLLEHRDYRTLAQQYLEILIPEPEAAEAADAAAGG